MLLSTTADSGIECYGSVTVRSCVILLYSIVFHVIVSNANLLNLAPKNVILINVILRSVNLMYVIVNNAILICVILMNVEF